ncbi:MAG: hypothetical protein K2X99_08395 [Gemmatimonadaceae bacterium]|nr:hypothetical protein [Gemmatimonadaceae bacterium]
MPSPIMMDRPSREVVTLYGVPTSESLALALAAAIESRRMKEPTSNEVRHLGVWPGRGAVGDAAWRDDSTGQLITRDLEIPFSVLAEGAERLLAECGSAIRRLIGGLLMTDWPEGTRRAVRFSLTPGLAFAGTGGSVEALLATQREADGLGFETDDD